MARTPPPARRRCGRSSWSGSAGAGEEVSCAPFREGWSPADTRSTGRLRARAQPSPPTADECLVPPGAGFQRLENQLYRVEIHTPAPGTPAGGAPATFKWSRENASVAARVERIQETVITVFDPARDPSLGFGPGQLVELTDLQRTLSGQPGALVQLESAQGPTMTVREWPGGAPPVLGAEPVVRRWESPAALPVTPGTPTAPAWVDLEDGVQVEFIGDEFRTGDYWLIPARTLTGSVEWPQVGGQPLFERRHGTAHHYAPLAILDFDGATWTIRHDCRRLFPPTTELIRAALRRGRGPGRHPRSRPRPGRTLPAPGRAPAGAGHQRRVAGAGSRRRLPHRRQWRLHARWTADRRRRSGHGSRGGGHGAHGRRGDRRL